MNGSIVMNIKDVTFEPLLSASRLSEIHKLTHDCFVESGLIRSTESKSLDIYSHLDCSERTIIITADLNDKMIATSSVTLDGEDGLQADTFFQQETDRLRKQYSFLGCVWRLCTAPIFRRNIQLLKKLIDHTIDTARQLGIEHCLHSCAARHESAYKRLTQAKTVARGVAQYQKNGPTTDFVLMMSKVSELGVLSKAGKN